MHSVVMSNSGRGNGYESYLSPHRVASGDIARAGRFRIAPDPTAARARRVAVTAVMGVKSPPSHTSSRPSGVNV